MTFNPKWIIGRTITAVNYDVATDLDGRDYHHNPTIILDNGAKIRFGAEETSDGDYGIEFLYVKPPR